MKIVACIKQVPDTTEVRIDKETNTLIREGVPSILNPDDANALEQALAFKDANEDVHITVVSMGPPQADVMLRECLAMGADEAVLLSDRAFGGSDTWATSNAIAAGIRAIGDYDLILAGRQAIDGDTAQVGPQIAEKLHLPQVTYAGEVTKEGESLIIKRMLEDGYMLVKVPTPCMITCIKELNTPRYMSVIGTEKCWDMPLKIMDFAALENHPLIDKTTIGLKGSPTNIYKSFTPPVKGGGMMLEGSDKNTTDELVSILTGKHII